MLAVLASDSGDECASARRGLLGRISSSETGRVYGSVATTGATRYRDATRHDRVARPPPQSIDPSPLRVAIDVGPLYGHRTGVGVAPPASSTRLSARADVDARSVRRELPVEADGRPPPAAGAGHRRLPPVGAHRSGRASTAGRTAPQVIHGTNYVVPPTRLPSRRVGVRLLVPAPPRTGVAGRAARRRATAAGGRRRRLRARQLRRHRRPCALELFDTDRVVTIPLGLPPAPPPLAVAAHTARSPTRSRGDPVRAGDRHRGATQGAAVARRGVRVDRRRAPPSCGSCWRVPRATTRRPSSRRSTRSIPSVRDRVLRIGAVDDADQALAAAPGGGARLPVARRGVRVPDPRGAAGGDAGRRQRRRRRSPRSVATACCSSRDAIRPAFAAALGRGDRRRRPATRADRGRTPQRAALRLGATPPIDWSPCTASSSTHRRPPQHDDDTAERASPCSPAASAPPASCAG